MTGRAEMGRDCVRGRRGFTLIELMLVLFIMATLSAMVMPSIASALRGVSLGGTASKLQDLMNFAYLSAISRRQQVTVNIDSENRRCWVSVQSVSLPWLEEEEPAGEPTARILTSMELPEGTEAALLRGDTTVASFQEGGLWEMMTFGSDGRTEDVTVELTDRDGARIALDVIGTTGEIRLREEE